VLLLAGPTGLATLVQTRPPMNYETYIHRSGRTGQLCCSFLVAAAESVQSRYGRCKRSDKARGRNHAPSHVYRTAPPCAKGRRGSAGGALHCGARDAWHSADVCCSEPGGRAGGRAPQRAASGAACRARGQGRRVRDVCVGARDGHAAHHRAEGGHQVQARRPAAGKSVLRSAHDKGMPRGPHDTLGRCRAIYRSCLASFIATFSRAVREEGRDCGSRRCACMRTRRRPQYSRSRGRSDPPIRNEYCTAAAAVCSEVCACVRACVQASDVVKAAKNDIIASLERLHQGSPLEYPEYP
jgi:hypothetical protein